jgi:stearoyl-CoA desaturase (delta-9 desaturase)
MYLLTALGVTVGFHRLITHRSFETYGWVKFTLAACGAMAVQGSMLQWAALHRRHHRYSDAPGDPHSPHPHDGGVRGVLRGAWHAHMGWLFAAVPADLDNSIKDLTRSRTLRVADALWPVWIVLGLAIPGLIGGLAKGDWPGVWSGVIWGGLVRMFLVHHVTFGVNSACHLWGSRPYRCADQSRNNAVVGVLALGEGWHNAHHAFPTSARHGLRWWQIDVSYYVICLMKWVGLAWSVRIPSAEAQQRSLRQAPEESAPLAT